MKEIKDPEKINTSTSSSSNASSSSNISNESFSIALANQGLVYGAVKAAGVLPRSFDYEDYIQDGLITYALFIDNNSKRDNGVKLTSDEVNRLAFRKIVWQTIDALRRQKFLSDISDFSLDEDFSEKEESFNNGSFKYVILYTQIDEAFNRLNNFDRIILTEHFLRGKKLKDISTTYGVSLQTVTRARKRVRDYLRQCISC